MQLKKKWVCLVFLFVLFPITASAQTGLYELQRGGMGVGFDFTGLNFSRDWDAIGIEGSLSYGINNRTKINLMANMGIINEDRYDSSEFYVPPPVMAGIESVHASPIGQTGLDYFLRGAFYTGFSRTLDAATNETLASARSIGFSSGGGILKRFETGFGWRLSPFGGISYSRSWTRLSVKDALEETGDNRISSGFGGRIGLEIELSPMISVIGTYGFSLEDFDGVFSIGLSLH